MRKKEEEKEEEKIEGETKKETRTMCACIRLISTFLPSFTNSTYVHIYNKFQFYFLMDFYRRFLALPLTERRHSVGTTVSGKRVK
jgi:hypothetical protein